METFDFISAFYREEYDADGLIAAVDSLLGAHKLVVHAVPFGCEEEAIGWLSGWPAGRRHVQLRYARGDLSAFSLDYTFRVGGKACSQSGTFFVIQDHEYRGAFVAVTVEPGDFYQRALLPLLGGLHPRAMLTFITHRRMQRLLESFRADGGFSDLVITRASAPSRHQGDDQVRRTIRAVSWPRLPLAEAFRWVEERNGWFESLVFQVKSGYRVRADMSFTRQGALRASALFRQGFNRLSRPVCKTIQENLQLFGHRARLERADLSTSPLVIDFRMDQFQDVDENRRLIQAMQTMQAAAVSVLHGNPYVHLSVLDYLDGSAFDVWVLDPRQLVIVPQLKASTGAVKRLVNHVFDNYAEGHLAAFAGHAV